MKAFRGFDMWDEAEPGICHKFILTNTETSEQFKLKVNWCRLSDPSTDAETMDRLLIYSDVAGKLREEMYYFW